MNTPFKIVLTAALILAYGVFDISAAAAADMRVEDGQTVVDQAGRRIAVKKPFSRIISLYGAHTENLFALGGGDGLIGDFNVGNLLAVIGGVADMLFRHAGVIVSVTGLGLAVIMGYAAANRPGKAKRQF